MKSLIKKVSFQNSTMITQLKVGCRTLSIVRKDHTIRGILDGTEIIVSAADSYFIDKLPKMIYSIVEDLLGGEKKGVFFKTNKSDELSESLYSKFFDEMGNHPYPIRIKSMKEFEPVCPVYDLRDPINLKDIMPRIPSLLNVVENITQILELSLNDALVLTKRKLVTTMWGAEKTQVAIDTVREGLLSLEHEASRLNLYYELFRKATERLIVFCKKSDADSVKVINNILIPDIISNFENIKSFASDLFFMTSPIIHIDEIFIKNTTYPSKFFLPEEILDTLLADYKLIVEFLNKVPEIEQEILNPLDLIRYNSKNIR